MPNKGFKQSPEQIAARTESRLETMAGKERRHIKQTTIDLFSDQIITLKQIAAEQNMGYFALCRQWLGEKIAEYKRNNND